MSATIAIFWLVVAFTAFIAAMAGVFAICVRERRRQSPLRTNTPARHPSDATAVLTDAPEALTGVAANADIGSRSPKIGHLQTLSETSLEGSTHDLGADAQSDNRVAMVIFGGIILGALLAVLVGYVVFFSGLAD
jgi:hypothetical protein